MHECRVSAVGIKIKNHSKHASILLLNSIGFLSGMFVTLNQRGKNLPEQIQKYNL